MEDAAGIRDSYRQVVGWREDPIAGVCHARGSNADLPPAWLVYWVVADLDASVEAVAEMGGEVVVAPRPLSGGSYSVIRDPAGAVSALYQPGG